MFGGAPSGYNDDVLNAETPNDEVSKQKLVNEIKDRAKRCVSIKNYPEAIRLYSKAIELCANEKLLTAVLYANRSSCYFGMNEYVHAAEDGSIAIEHDPSYVKGYYRRTVALMALSNYNEAKTIVMKGLELKPGDKELMNQLSKIETSITSEKSKPDNAPVEKAKEINNNMKKVTKPASSSKSTTNESTMDHDDDEEDLNALNLRGYKKKADGTVTTFFNNDLDEEAKRLIGDIAPKKLDSTPSSIKLEPSINGTSVWNAAGTYEERILTPWASNYLKESIESTCYEIHPDGFNKTFSFLMKVEAVENLAGDAQVSMVRGKRKHICDFTFDVKCILEMKLLIDEKVPSSDGKLPPSSKVQVKYHVLDITADEEYEIQLGEVNESEAASGKAVGAVIPPTLTSQYIRGSNHALSIQQMIGKKIVQFCKEFKMK